MCRCGYVFDWLLPAQRSLCGCSFHSAHACMGAMPVCMHCVFVCGGACVADSCTQRHRSDNVSWGIPSGWVWSNTLLSVFIINVEL